MCQGWSSAEDLRFGRPQKRDTSRPRPPEIVVSPIPLPPSGSQPLRSAVHAHAQRTSDAGEYRG